MENRANSTDEFLTGSIPSVVIKNALPAVIAMIMVVVYNFADTFFISFTGDDFQTAAVQLGAPVFMIFMSLGTLFGVGGTSVISRALGDKDEARAKKACSFCMWSSAGIGLILSVLLCVFTKPLVSMLNAQPNSFDHACTYVRITVTCGAFSMVSNCLSNLLRAEGKAMKAMTGTLIGNLLNIILDGVFVLGLDWGVKGVAIATVIGNVVGCLYYLFFYISGKSVLGISLKDFTMRGGIFKEVIAIGISASLANLLVSFTTIIINQELGDINELFVPAYGVTSKILMIVSMLGIGISAGIQPILGFCYGSKAKKRFMDYLKFSLLFTTGVCLAVAVICFIFARPIVNGLLNEKEAMEAGLHFTKIMLLSVWLTGAFVVLQNTLQAMGAAVPALLASLFRQAVLYIPVLYIMEYIIGADGLIWAQPVCDVVSMIVIVLMLVLKLKKVEWTSVEMPEKAQT